MDVTKNNFAETLPLVKAAIDGCDFLAIDTELTGLYNTRSTEHAFDTMQERYSKLRGHCSKFLIIQFGVSTFKYHPEENRYTHKDFNFYVFPRPHIRQAPDPSFLCQTSSLHFLASHGFDFNRAIYDGIPYLTLAHEEKIQTYLENKYKMERDSLASSKNTKTNGQKAIDIPDEHKEFIAAIHERVDSFISKGTDTIIQLEPCNAYRRKLIYETVQQKHQSGIEMSSHVNEDNMRFITIMKCSEEDKLDKIHTKEGNDLDDVDTAVGFRKVMDHISNSKKLIIGHNMYLDILHVIEQFFFTLPEEVREFKSMVRITFPHLVDTKVMASSDKLKPFIDNTGLSNLLKTLHGKDFDLPKIETEDGFKGYNLKSEQLHEAGFDAFMTGICYIAMSRKLGSLQSPQVTHVETSSRILSPYCNRLNVMRHYDIRHLNLLGPDPEPNRDYVFYVGFPQEWKTVDLVELFLPFGDIYVHWLDDSSALVALKNPANAISAKSLLLKRSSRIYRVKSYAEYLKWVSRQIGGETEVVKKPCESSENKPTSATKRRNSGHTEASGSCNMDLIPEADENEAEFVFIPAQPPKKKPRPVEPEDVEVSSTAKVFLEEDTW